MPTTNNNNNNNRSNKDLGSALSDSFYQANNDLLRELYPSLSEKERDDLKIPILAQLNSQLLVDVKKQPMNNKVELLDRIRRVTYEHANRLRKLIAWACDNKDLIEDKSQFEMYYCLYRNAIYDSSDDYEGYMRTMNALYHAAHPYVQWIHFVHCTSPQSYHQDCQNRHSIDYHRHNNSSSSSSTKKKRGSFNRSSNRGSSSGTSDQSQREHQDASYFPRECTMDAPFQASLRELRFAEALRPYTASLNVFNTNASYAYAFDRYIRFVHVCSINHRINIIVNNNGDSDSDGKGDRDNNKGDDDDRELDELDSDDDIDSSDDDDKEPASHHPAPTMIPSLDIDFMWHAHMASGSHYLEHIQRLTNGSLKLLDHNHDYCNHRTNDIRATELLWHCVYPSVKYFVAPPSHSVLTSHRHRRSLFRHNVWVEGHERDQHDIRGDDEVDAGNLDHQKKMEEEEEEKRHSRGSVRASVRLSIRSFRMDSHTKGTVVAAAAAAAAEDDDKDNNSCNSMSNNKAIGLKKKLKLLVKKGSGGGSSKPPSASATSSLFFVHERSHCHDHSNDYTNHHHHHHEDHDCGGRDHGGDRGRDCSISG